MQENGFSWHFTALSLGALAACDTPFDRLATILQTQRVARPNKAGRGYKAILGGAPFSENFRGASVMAVSRMLRFSLDSLFLSTINRFVPRVSWLGESQAQLEIDFLSNTVSQVLFAPLGTVFCGYATDEEHRFGGPLDVVRAINAKVDLQQGGYWERLRAFYAGVEYDILAATLSATSSVAINAITDRIHQYFTPGSQFSWQATAASFALWAIVDITIYPIDTLSNRAKVLASLPAIDADSDKVSQSIDEHLFDGIVTTTTSYLLFIPLSKALLVFASTLTYLSLHVLTNGWIRYVVYCS